MRGAGRRAQQRTPCLLPPPRCALDQPPLVGVTVSPPPATRPPAPPSHRPSLRAADAAGLDGEGTYKTVCEELVTFDPAH